VLPHFPTVQPLRSRARFARHAIRFLVSATISLRHVGCSWIAMHARSISSSESIRDRFLADHRRLEDLFEEMLDAFEAGAREELSQIWTRFESDLQRHMDAEEKFLIPAFARINASEAAALLADHKEFRCRLAELGVGVDLHIVRLAVASKFVERLRAHAHREDELMYRWADEHLDEGVRISLVGALEHEIIDAARRVATAK
jgi:hemerythrin-like domain-containing protein